MKIALINPPLHNLIRTTLPKFIDDNEGNFQPLGIMYIASYLKAAHGGAHEVSIIDACLENLGYEQIAERTLALKCDVVGITCWTFSLLDTLKAAEAVKKSLPGVKIVLGGPHVGIYPEETLSFGFVDYVIVNDGEKAFSELIKQLAGGGKLDEVPNLYYRQDGAVRKSPVQYIEQDLDALPFPDRKAVDVSKYYSFMETVLPYTTMITSRGCPFHCRFCFKQDTGWRSRSVDSMIAEIKECRAAGIRNFFIFDETFTVNKRRTLEFCDRIISEKLDIVWSCRSRVDTIDEPTLKKLREAGCLRMSFGVESADEKVLAKLDKRIKLEDAVRVFDAAKRQGIKTLADFMLCCPEETPAITEKTVDFACKLDPDYIQFSLFTLLPATGLYDEALAKGILPGDVWKDYALRPSGDFKPPLWNAISEHDSLATLTRAYKKFYLRPSRVLRALLSVASLSQLKAYVKTGLSLVLEMVRLSGRGPGRK